MSIAKEFVSAEKTVGVVDESVSTKKHMLRSKHNKQQIIMTQTMIVTQQVELLVYLTSL